MTIGILTYYKSHNYGAMLQAVALRKILHDMGHEAAFIDYWPQHQKNIYRIFVWEEFWCGDIKGRLRYFKRFLKTLYPKLIRRKKFNLFYKEQIYPYVRSQKNEYDIIVYGSDQIWRKQGWGYGYNPVYFGKNSFKAKKKIAYAASMGTLPDNTEDNEIVREFLKHIDKISVRERELKLFLEKIGFQNVEQTIDPTFLLSREDWSSFAGGEPIIHKPYLLFYDLQIGAFDPQGVNNFAREKGLMVITIRGYSPNPQVPTREVRTTDGPYEFLNLLYHANYVITSSFHGLAFAIIFQKPFLVSLFQNKSRVDTLLKSLDLFDRLVPNNQVAIAVNEKDINWSKVQIVLDKLKDQSLTYLKKSI